jgi:hypothetical protein
VIVTYVIAKEISKGEIDTSIDEVEPAALILRYPSKVGLPAAPGSLSVALWSVTPVSRSRANIL